MTARVATLAEIETHYSLADLLDANEALDIRDDMEIWANQPRGK